MRDYLVYKSFQYMTNDEFNKFDDQMLTDKEFSILMHRILNILYQERNKTLINFPPNSKLSNQTAGIETVPKDTEYKIMVETGEIIKSSLSTEDEFKNQKITEQLEKIESLITEKSKSDIKPEPEEDPYLRSIKEISAFMGCGDNKSQNLKKEFQFIFTQNGRKFMVNKYRLQEEIQKKYRKGHIGRKK